MTGLMSVSALQLHEICEPEALEGLAEEWRELWERCPGLHCFQRPEWLLPWVRHFFRGQRIWTLAIRHNGRLAGLAPFFLHRHHRNSEVRQVSFLGAGITDYLDILCEPEIEEQAVRMVFQFLWDNRARWDICDFQELSDRSPVVSADVAPGMCQAWLRCGTCPVVALPGTESEFDESLRGRFKNLRRTIHKIERDPDVEITAVDAENYREHLLDLFRLHRERWKERHETGMFANPAIRGFHLDVAAGFMPAGMLRSYRMRYQGETISVWYGFASRGRYYAYLTGFDPEFARLSPGQVLLAHSMKSAIAEGAGSYDFLRKTEDFKYRWGGVDMTNRRLLCWHAKSRLPGSNFVEEARADLEAL